jgi:hypothetical protein
VFPDGRRSSGAVRLPGRLTIETVALGVASTNEPLRLVTKEIFETWIDRASDRDAAAGLDTPASRALAIAIIAGLEGTFVLARAMRSSEPLDDAPDQLCAALRSTVDRDSRATSEELVGPTGLHLGMKSR